MKPLKNSHKKEKSETDITSVSLSCDAGLKVFGFSLPVFLSDQINEAARASGMNRASFVRKAIADAIVASGIELKCSMPEVKHGSRKDFHDPGRAQKARAQIASARAVRDWKRDLRKRHDAYTADAIAQTWDNAAAKAGRKLRLDELEQCEREIVAALRAAESGFGEFPELRR